MHWKEIIYCEWSIHVCHVSRIEKGNIAVFSRTVNSKSVMDVRRVLILFRLKKR